MIQPFPRKSMRSPLIFLLSSSSLPCISFKTLLLAVAACLLGGSGLIAAAQATVSPTSVTWSKVAVGQAGGQKVVTLTNTGSSQISISSIAFTGTAAADFEVFSKTCGSTLAASASCTANIIFKPTSTGTLTATLNFTDTASGSPQQVPVSGTGTSAVAASPASLSFGATVGSTSASQTITVTNSTGSAVTLGAPGITGTDASDFGATNACGSSLAASSSCTASVDFKPTTAGTLTATWSITAGSSPLTVTLSGTSAASGGSASASPSSISWGTVAVGNAGGQKVATLTNSGSSAITIDSIGLTGTNAGDFAVFSKTCGSTLAASASCTANIIFKPTASGTRTATLNFTDSAGNSPQQIALTGGSGGSTGSVTASPASISFGTVQTSSTSASQNVTVSNGTSSAVTLSGAGITGTDAGDFAVTSTNCGSSLSASATCTASIDFKPAVTGTLTASWSVTSSSSSTPLIVALSGTGSSGSGSGSAVASPATVSFGTSPVGTPTATFSVTLKNNGTSSFSMTGISVTGADPSDFEETKQTCGTGLAAGGECVISLIFDPTAIGTRTATLSVSDTAGNSPQTVALTGTGAAAPTTTLTFNPSSQSWGSQTIGTTVTKTFTLTAGGSGTLSFNSFGFTGVDSGDFSITANSCGSTLASGSSCSITVAFKPSTLANRVALLSVADSGIASPQTAEVSGAGAYSAAQTASITVDFGSRSGSQVAIPANILGTEYFESLPTNANRTSVVQAGFTFPRYRLQVQTIFTTSATSASWGQLNSDMNKMVAAGVHPILEVENTPTFLQPSPLRCSAAPETSVPTNFNEWGQLAAQIVAHMDATFPGLAQYYEIWNEPDTDALCSASQLNDYLSIYAAAAPLMKAQSATDQKANSADKPIFVGGPATAGPAFPSLLTNSSTAPYVDFYSYHFYPGSATTIRDGMTWDGAGGTTSLLNLVTNSSTGMQSRYLLADSYVKAGKTPLGANTPIFYDEYNDDWWFYPSSQPDCCRNSPIYSPVFNALAVTQIFNSVYHGANQVPSNMIYFAAAQPTFCILGVIDAAMDCGKAASGAEAQPYPQYYAYRLMFAPSYLDLQSGGHMASSITLSSSASADGLYATAFYTPSADSVLITNPTSSSYSGVTVQINNSGLSSPTATLYTINASNPTASAWPATIISASGGTQATFDLPPYSVLAISLQ